MAQAEQQLWWYTILHEKVLSTLIDHKVGKNELILDIGCGTGGLMQRLTSQKFTTKGIDISDMAIDYCKKKILT